MNEKVRNVLLLISVVIVLLIFVDLIFNISGNGVENFSIGEAYGGSSSKESGSDEVSSVDKTNIKSIVSKHDGRMFNVLYIKSDPKNKTIVIPSPVKRNSNITVNGDGTLSETLKMSAKPDQQFELMEIPSSTVFHDTLPDYKRGANLDDTHYPFWIVKSKRTGWEDWCLAYEPGRLFLSPIGNYNNQKWDVSNLINPKESVLTHTVSDSSLGSFNNTGANDPLNQEVYDPNKIKINLNLTPELKKQLFNIDESSAHNGSGSGSGSGSETFRGSSGNSIQSCGTQVPEDSIESICPGCKTY